MDSEERRNLEAQLATHRRNLQVLEQQKASYGIAPPLQIVNGIDFERREIAALEKRLAGGAAPPTVTAAPAAARPGRAAVGLDYQLGLQSLKAALPAAALNDFALFEARLRENLDSDRRYGATETTRADRAKIVDALNQLALQHLGHNFNDLC